jgi:hypothetical protein
MDISQEYTCHAWIDKRLIICTAVGDILIAEMSGDFKMVLASSPGPQFSTIQIHQRLPDGFIVADSKGKFKIY